MDYMYNPHQPRMDPTIQHPGRRLHPPYVHVRAEPPVQRRPQPGPAVEVISLVSDDEDEPDIGREGTALHQKRKVLRFAEQPVAANRRPENHFPGHPALPDPGAAHNHGVAPPKPSAVPEVPPHAEAVGPGPENDDHPAEEGDTSLLDKRRAGEVVPLILALIPDLCPEYARKVLDERVFANESRKISSADACSEILAFLFDSDDKTPYPKQSAKRKAEDDSPSDRSSALSKKRRLMLGDEDPDMEYLPSGELNYRNEKAGLDNRKGFDYRKLMTSNLSQIYPLMTLKHITDTIQRHNGLFVPSYIDLAFEYALPVKDRSWRAMTTARVVKASLIPAYKYKGKNKVKTTKLQKLVDGRVVCQVREIMDDGGESAFIAEKEFLIRILYAHGDTPSIEALKILDPLEGEGDAECQCCFSNDHAIYMLHCEDGHTFCRDCVKMLLETSLGDQKSAHCMDASGCKTPFHEREIRKALPLKLAESYFALVQRKELEAAGLENLETCPTCEYAIVIDNENEKLFRCEHPECGRVSCRLCKKPDHIPKSCEEAAADGKLDTRHAVEEAMTRALVRTCPNPKCQKSFLKEAGCNKMTCQSCGTISCYICRATIQDYDHFHSSGRPDPKKPCRLWDPPDAATANALYLAEVADARKVAQDAALHDAALIGQVIAQEDIDVALHR